MKCRCHNTDKVWQRDSRKKNGGYWRCRWKHVTFRLNNRDYIWREIDRKRRSRREAVIAQMDAKIEELLSTYPFLKEVFSVS